jgi:exodeoxyribonuclease-3
MADTLKIASWNINSVRFRMEIVERFLREEAPDVLCLQETKTVDETFPADAFRRLGYTHLLLNGQRMHHGVAIVSKVPCREDDRLDWQANGEARHIGVRLENGMRIENVYVPAGGDVPDRTVNPKFGQKLDFLERMIAWSETLSVPTLLVGDFNVAPLESDSTPGGAIARRTGWRPIAAAGSTICGRRRTSPRWPPATRSMNPAEAG